jgi:hypothetical protein
MIEETRCHVADTQEAHLLLIWDRAPGRVRQESMVSSAALMAAFEEQWR